MLERSSLYMHTLSHLRPAQIAGQLWMRARSLWRPWLRQQTSSAAHSERCHVTPGWFCPLLDTHQHSRIRHGYMTFINRTRHVQWPPIWQQPEAPMLWQYNQHYFDWLWSLEPEQAILVTEDWMDFAKRQPEHIAWDPYPTSLRLMNWCGVFLSMYNVQSTEKAFYEKLWSSIKEQADWLCYHLEYHLMGNHLLENAFALTLLGSLFRGEHGARWYRIGYTLLKRELSEQILTDGMHFERSPMYHLRVVYLSLLLAQQGRPEAKKHIKQLLPNMLDAMHKTAHPDGDIALLNDSAIGIYPGPQQLTQYAQALHIHTQSTTGVWSLPDAGYFGAHTKDGDAIICDAGPIGPDYIPGHAHGDIFSYELSLKGQRIIVDSGVFDYEDTEHRRYSRSTRAHNTVEVEHSDQCEFWGSFRVGRRARILGTTWSPEQTRFSLRASHDGYMRLQGKQVRHTRQFVWSGERSFRVHDQLSARASITAISRIHLHPSVFVQLLDEQTALLTTHKQTLRVEFFGHGTLDMTRDAQETQYFPQFSVSQPNTALRFRAEGTQLDMGYKITWES